MNERLFIQLCELVLSLAVAGGISFIFAATWYDLRIIRLRKLSPSLPPETSDQPWPHITVLIYAHNSEPTIQSCLRSIRANQYARYNVVIANNASTDITRKHVAFYKRLHPDMPIRMYSTKSITNRVALLRRALKDDRMGQLVISLDANDILSSSALQGCAFRFMNDEQLEILRLRYLPTSGVSIRTLTYYFYTLSMNFLLKSFARYSRLYLNSSMRNGFAFKRSALIKRQSLSSKSVDYASNIHYTQVRTSDHSTAQSPAARPITTLLLFLVSTLFVICIVSYFFYTAAILQSNLLLTLSWTATSLWLLAIVWLDDALPKRIKFDLTTTVPFLYFYLYAYQFVIAIALLRQIKSAIPLPYLPYNKIQIALVAELYSTRY